MTSTTGRTRCGYAGANVSRVTDAPLPKLPDVTPTWGVAAELAGRWELNALARRLGELAKAQGA